MGPVAGGAIIPLVIRSSAAIATRTSAPVSAERSAAISPSSLAAVSLACESSAVSLTDKAGYTI